MSETCKRNPFDVLGVSPDAPFDVILNVYNELRRKLSPERYQGTALEHVASNRLKEVEECFREILRLKNSDDERFKGYRPGHYRPHYGGYYRRGDCCPDCGDLCTACACIWAADTCCECSGGDCI
ncbi:J domain-containing protein [Fervidobacterium thailandense]|uniref:J domain-containing protein n=1 Tax=Fervidobacterium thailandense TaxID=1008305 RepID=A0A1E3G2K6_9BACT|nr:J domain-containing protein [Fervidobacterium thailandense]ODN30495.1 hypothetical protein A4H02_05565 [Fervidobacterium thailandense]